MKLGFIILAHDQPDAVRHQVDILAGAGHNVVIHFDKKGSAKHRKAVRSIEKTYPDKVRVICRVRCVWGEWSLVKAVLVALREFERMTEKPDYIHLMSGADFPIRPITDLEEFLRRNPGKDFIECCDITQRRWVKGGLSMERFWFYFPVNFRSQRKTFDRLVYLQRKLKIRRKIPYGMTPNMGSQWWTLRWESCAKILDFLAKNPSVIRYYRTTWIPDESFFQTVLAHLIPRREIADLQLTLHHLTPTGRPYVIYPDHIPLIRKLPHFFIRKVSASAFGGIYALAHTRRAPIPRPSHLACARDLVRSAIDQNYERSSLVPGHPNGSAPEVKHKPFVVFLTENSAATEHVREQVKNHAQTVWIGRPFAPDMIDLSDELLARMGLARGMISVRNNFSEQFIDALVNTAYDGEMVALAVQNNEDSFNPTALCRIPRAVYIRTSYDPNVTYDMPKPVRFISPDGISSQLDEIAKLHWSHHANRAKSENPPDGLDWFEAHTFGRIGDYFHLYATLHTSINIAADLEFVLPGCSKVIRPKSLFVRKQSAGSFRILCLFWVERGASLIVSEKSPAFVIHPNITRSSLKPIPIGILVHSSVDKLVALMDEFDATETWFDRLVLESASFSPISRRFNYIHHAMGKTHCPPSSKQLDHLISKRDPSFGLFALHTLLQKEDHKDDLRKFIMESPLEEYDFDTLTQAITLLCDHDFAAACQLALRRICMEPLSREDILAALQPCLPRDSRWWLLSLGEDEQLGDEQIADALNCAATAALDQENHILAELCLRTALRISPDSQSAAWNIGLFLTAQNRSEEALAAYRIVSRHYSEQSLSTRWPSFNHSIWPHKPWPTVSYALPKGVTTWPRISIITPSYNQGQYIEETILSILNQNYPNLQYIVVDGNSTDDTRDVLECYRSRIDHLIIEPDDGQTQAINKGFRLADGEIIAWLNSDDMYGPGTLHQVALHWLESGADVLAGICAEHRNHAFRVINKPSATNRDFNTAQLARIFPCWFEGRFFFQPEVFFTKAILNKVGLLDESLHYAMDYDLWMRFAKAGAKLKVIDWPFAFFRLHDAQKTTQAIACIAEQCAVRNRQHPIELLEEFKIQIHRKLGSLHAEKLPTIAVFGPYYESVVAKVAALPQTNVSLILPTLMDGSALTLANAAVILIGSKRQEIQLLKTLRALHPELLLIGWFLDQDHNPHANHEAALLVDVIIPTDARTGDYLRNDSAIMGPAVRVMQMSELMAALFQVAAR